MRPLAQCSVAFEGTLRGYTVVVSLQAPSGRPVRGLWLALGDELDRAGYALAEEYREGQAGYRWQFDGPPHLGERAFGIFLDVVLAWAADPARRVQFTGSTKVVTALARRWAYLAGKARRGA